MRDRTGQRRMVMPTLLVVTTVAVVTAAMLGVSILARIFAVTFLVVEVVWTVQIWRRRADQHRLRRHIAALAEQGQSATAILVLHAVAGGAHHLPDITNAIGPAKELDTVLERLRRVGMLTVTWEEQPGHQTRPRYDLSPAARAHMTNTLYPDTKPR